MAVSHATADELIALRLARPEQIAIIPSGIDVDRFRNLPSREEARRSFGISTDGPVAGWVGRHFPQKRPEVVLEVARRLVRTMPEASFLMVGDGPSFEEAVASTEDEPRIHVVGFRNDIETAYAAMDLLAARLRMGGAAPDGARGGSGRGPRGLDRRERCLGGRP